MRELIPRIQDCKKVLTTVLTFLQVLRDQGLGKYCDPEFVKAASREMQEAMDITPEEFDEAAHRLLQAEQVSNGQL